jgi:hypothetical protein
MSKTFYSEFREASRARRDEQVLAAAVSSHLRLGQISSLSKGSPDVFRNIGDFVPREPLPHLQMVDGLEREPQAGISAKHFNPHDPGKIDMNLLLSITVALEGHHQSETIFCGRVLPLMAGGNIWINTIYG